ncbi:hypothetical protein N9Y67_01955 [Pseudomonadota bacterium]|nr:hypothetical protein [Pseudomonadota bacterium]
MDEQSLLGEKYIFWTETGEVLSHNRQTNTNISGGGGINGNISSITTSVKTKHEIWLRDDDGKEKSIILNTDSVSIREGQRLSFMYVAQKGENGQPMAYRNHTAEKFTPLMTETQFADKIVKVKRTGCAAYIGFVFFMCIILGIFSTLGYVGFGWLLFLASVVIGPLLYSKEQEKRIKNSIKLPFSQDWMKKASDCLQQIT